MEGSRQGVRSKPRKSSNMDSKKEGLQQEASSASQNAVKNSSKVRNGNCQLTELTVADSVGSVHFQIVPWSCLYFSRSIGPLLCSRC